MAGASTPPAPPPFTEVYMEYLPRITGFLRSKLNDASDADDVASLVFTRAFQAYARYEARNDSPAAWLFKIARNAALDHCRRNQQRQRAEQHAYRDRQDSADPIGLAERRLECRELRRAVAQLPYRQRLSLTLKLEEGLSFREIGARLACSEDAAKMLYHRSLRAARRLCTPSALLEPAIA
jgi:RNA polymerase sigma-70 factor, ECF subfamily